MNVKLIGKHEKDSRACRDGLALTLDEMMAQDKSICYVDCDLMGCINTKMLQKNYPDRAFEAGIAEGNAAGVAAGDAASVRVERDYDDGRLEYEVKFWVDTTEYEYTVDGATGDIRKSEREPHPSASSADIGQEQAVSIALAHAGLSQSQVYGLEAEREWEDDHLEYQVEFKAGGMEYSYDIAASDGAILSFEREKD